ncbi:MAG TPA: hybrid sensor histidine kinase/response regulator, partial [Casimicrobiaceae bacterium]
DGYEVARLMRERATRPIKLVALTGWGQESDRRRARGAGFDAHLVKPVNPETLQRTIGGAR